MAQFLGVLDWVNDELRAASGSNGQAHGAPARDHHPSRPCSSQQPWGSWGLD
ncbi:MAG: hypothetical protein JNM75_13780 [Rhodospirillales bacterium]|nr:hypothetical protein [Rhodospirillales bacterium]